MPIYEVEAPNGQILEIEGDTPPSEQDLDNIFKNTNTQNIQPQEPIKAGVSVDITPSGLFKGSQNVVASALTAPIVAKRDNISVKDAYNQNMDKAREWRKENPTPFQDFAVDTAGYTGLSLIPGLEPVAAAKNAGTAARLGNFALNAAKVGAIPGALEGLKNGIGSAGLGALGGSAIAGGIMAGVPVVGNVTKRIANSPFTKNLASKTVKFLTSVPEEYTNRAIEKELAGKSILKGKFDKKDLNQNYRQAGKKAIEGFQEAKLKANQELNDATLNLNKLEEINNEQLVNNIINELDRYAYGGEANAAIEQKGKDIYNYLDEIASRKSNSGLHVTKRNIQNAIRNKYGQETGEGINALKDIARNINEKLYKISPEYEAANVAEQKLHDINDLLGGMNKKTIASKLRNAETDATIRSGYNQALEELNNLVDPQYKFLDDVNDLRAREALEQWYPGQFGPSGSPEGFGNLVKSSLIGGAAALGTHNPLAALAGALSVSPKITGQGIIKGLGGLQNIGNKLIDSNGFVGNVARRVLPAAFISMPPLQAGVTYNEYN